MIEDKIEYLSRFDKRVLPIKKSNYYGKERPNRFVCRGEIEDSLPVANHIVGH